MHAPQIAFVLGFILAGAATAAAQTTPRGLVKVKGAPDTLPPTEIAGFAAG